MEEEEEERGTEEGQSPNPSPGHALGTGSCQPFPNSCPCHSQPSLPSEGAFPQIWVKIGISRARSSLPASPSSSLELNPACRRKQGSYPTHQSLLCSPISQAGREKQDQGSASTRQQWGHHIQRDGTPSLPALGPACPQGGSPGVETPKGQKNWEMAGLEHPLGRNH